MKYRETTIIPSRIVKARKSLNMTQAQFAANIREHLPEDGTISAILVSAWETGRRNCRAEVLEIISNLSGYPIDYFHGLCDEKGEATVRKNQLDNLHNLKEISFENIYQYDQLPVYVEFMEHQHPSGWALVDFANKELVFTRYVIKINSKNFSMIKIYENKPFYDFSQEELAYKRLDLGTLFTLNRVYVVMNSIDPVVRAKYNGWYSHNGDKTALQNHIGLVLSYDGLGIAYNAYPDIIFKEHSPM